MAVLGAVFRFLDDLVEEIFPLKPKPRPRTFQSRSPRFPAPYLMARVRFVHDGDTVTVQTAESEIRVRLDSIDCPENDQPWGNYAKAGLIKLIGGRNVQLEAHGLDSYGRTLATLYVKSENEVINVNEKMVARGHAWVVGNDSNHLSKNRKSRLISLENFARSKRMGLWKAENPIAPWAWRAS